MVCVCGDCVRICVFCVCTCGCSFLVTFVCSVITYLLFIKTCLYNHTETGARAPVHKHTHTQILSKLQRFNTTHIHTHTHLMVSVYFWVTLSPTVQVGEVPCKARVGSLLFAHQWLQHPKHNKPGQASYLYADGIEI